MAGRPKAEIDWNKVNEYLKAQCDGTGIASMLGIHPDTLYLACKDKYKMTFSAYSAIKKAEGKELLRAKQYEIAIGGDKSMLIWLGKQYLDQSERSDHKLELPQFDKLPDIIINARDSNTE